MLFDDKLERLLERDGLIGDELIAQLKENAAPGASLYETLLQSGLLSEDQLIPLAAECLNIEAVHGTSFPVDLMVASRIAPRTMLKQQVLPLDIVNGGLNPCVRIATPDPFDMLLLADMEDIFGVTARAVLIGPETLERRVFGMFGDPDAGASIAIEDDQEEAFELEDESTTDEDDEWDELLGDLDTTIKDSFDKHSQHDLINRTINLDLLDHADLISFDVEDSSSLIKPAALELDSSPVTDDADDMFSAFDSIDEHNQPGVPIPPPPPMFFGQQRPQKVSPAPENLPELERGFDLHSDDFLQHQDDLLGEPVVDESPGKPELMIPADLDADMLLHAALRVIFDAGLIEPEAFFELARASKRVKEP